MCSSDLKTQCIQSAQDKNTNICVGAIANTSITIASRQPTADVEAMFGTLKPNVDWTPGGGSSSTATPSTTNTPAAATPTATK